MRCWTRLLAASIFALWGCAALAANVGQWQGSLRSWNHPDMALLRAALVAAGHTLEADGPISASALANDQVFLIASWLCRWRSERPGVAVEMVELQRVLFLQVLSPSDRYE